MISLIAACNSKRVIGRNGLIPWNFSEDLEFFRQKTMGKVVIMGRLTYESINGGLPGRTIIVVSQKMKDDDVIVANSCEEAFDIAHCLSYGEELFIAGGQQIYEQFMPIAHKIYLTMVDNADDGDAFFPEINMNEWKRVARRGGKNPRLMFDTYERKRHE